MNLEEFIKIIRESEDSGVVSCSKPLTDYDLMIQFAIGKIGERKGYPCDIEIDEIFYECTKMGDYANKLLHEQEVEE